MLVRLVRFSLAPGKHAAAQALADDLVPQIRALSGCHGVHVFGDEPDGEYGLFVLWESQEDADAAADLIAPQLMSHLAGKVTEKPTRRLYSVIG